MDERPLTRVEKIALDRALRRSVRTVARGILVTAEGAHMTPKWNYEGKPDAPGWYPALHSWEAEEGSFPAALHWTGAMWSWDEAGAQSVTNVVVAWLPGPMDRERAHRIALENDPGL